MRCTASRQPSLSLDLLARIEQALDVGRSTLDAALSPRGTDPLGAQFGEGKSAPAPLSRAKVVAEIALFLRSLAGVAREHRHLAAAIDDTARLLMRHARGEEVISTLCRDPGNALGHAAAHIHLGALGYADADFDSLLDECTNGAHGCSEKMPNHAFEHEWLRSVWRGGTITELDCRWPSTALAKPLDLLGGSLTDFYIFSHLVLYGSDVGTRQGHWPRPTVDIAADAETGLAAALDAGNLDLAAEMLWTWPMLRLPWSAAANFGFDLVASAQDAHGFVPGPGYDAAICEALPAALRHDYVLRTSYHATLVMGIVCATALAAGTSSRRHDGPGSPEAMADILDLLPVERRPWRASLASIEPADQQLLLCDFALSIALRKNAASNDLPGLRDCLSVAVRHDLANSVIGAQGAAMLRRATIAGRLTSDRARHYSSPSTPSSSSVASSTSTER